MSEEKTDNLSNFRQQRRNDKALECDYIHELLTENLINTTNQGAQSWVKLLRGWLPSPYDVATKGRIVSQDGRISREVDILVLKRASSKKFLNRNLYVATSVAAAFECKTILAVEHIMEAIRTCTEIKSLYPVRVGTPYRELHAPIIYGVLAGSHSWNGENATPESNIGKILSVSDGAYVLHPRECLDLLCVADLGTWKTVKVLTPLALASHCKTQMRSVLRGDFTLQTAYMMGGSTHKNDGSHFTPTRSFISNFSRKLAWEDAQLRDMSQCCPRMKMERLGSSRPRPWNFSFSRSVKRQFRNHRLNFDDWSEWSVTSGL